MMLQPTTTTTAVTGVGGVSPYLTSAKEGGPMRWGPLAGGAAEFEEERKLDTKLGDGRCLFVVRGGVRQGGGGG